jgi:hypothetical protein
MSLYKPEDIGKWKTLDEHLDHPNDDFPRMVMSGFLVVFSPPPGYEGKYPWNPGDPVLFLGEIPGMKGHGIFAGADGLVKWGYHTFNFHVIPKDEL